MHELSIAMSLIDLACSEVQLAKGEVIDVVNVEMGAHSGVVADALRFSFEVAAVGTPVEGARLAIRDVAGTALQLVSIEVRQ